MPVSAWYPLATSRVCGPAPQSPPLPFLEAEYITCGFSAVVRKPIFDVLGALVECFFYDPAGCGSYSTLFLKLWAILRLLSLLLLKHIFFVTKIMHVHCIKFRKIRRNLKTANSLILLLPRRKYSPYLSYFLPVFFFDA